MSHHIDEWDRQIIAILQKDGRASHVDMARQLGLAEATVRKRVDRLRSSGVIDVIAVADPEKMGLVTRMIIAVQVDQSQIEAIASRLAAFPEVCSVSMLTGTYDIMLDVALPSSGSLLSFILDRIVTIPGVTRTDTYNVLKVVKRFCDWVIPDVPANGMGQPTRHSTSSSSQVVPGAIVVPT
jgi:Lrp/AsnC family transcriptional regulator, regulator for asnA, asnC and gidA